MKLKLGDLVIRKDESYNLLFRVSEFDGKYVILKGIKIPVITVSTRDKLIKLNRKRNKINTGLRRVK